MKNRYRIVKVGSRGGTYYSEDTTTGQRKSLETKNKLEAEKLLHAKNEADRQPQLNVRMGMAYLSGVDPKLATRTWADVMRDVIQDKTGANRPNNSKRYNFIQNSNNQRIQKMQRRTRILNSKAIRLD